jgi:hypothetical protein
MVSHPVDLDVVGWGRDHGVAHVDVEHYDTWHRLGRAIKAVALVWLVAVPLLFIPWVFVLVIPGAVGLSVYFFAQHIQSPDVARTCSGTCPDCSYVGQFDVPLHFELPLAIGCPQCSRELTLETQVDAE